MSKPYQAIESKRVPTKLLSKSKENKFWDAFQIIHKSNETASVNIVSCGNEKKYYAIGYADIIDLYDCKKAKFKTKLQKFKSDTITSATFRKDGNMLAIGEIDGRVHVLETKKKNILRTFRKHTKAVYASTYLPNLAILATGADDLTVKVFDVASNQIIRDILDLHADYIRSLKVLSENENLLLVGSYDSTVSLVDLRTLSNKAVMRFNHESPVEALAVYPDDKQFCSAGGNTVSIWDIRNSKPTQILMNNLKTVTSVKYVDEGKRLITGSLDQHMKIYDVETQYQICHQIKFPAGIMSFDLTNDLSHLIVGMNDGLYEIRQRKADTEEEKKDEMPLPKIESENKKIIRNYKFFYRGIYEQPTEFDVQFEAERKRNLQDYDKYMKRFQYKNALNAALRKQNSNVVIGLIEELVQRGTLDIALKGRDEAELDLLFDFVQVNSKEARFRYILVPLIERMTELYANELIQKESIRQKFAELSNHLEIILREQELMSDILGKLEVIIDSNLLSGESA